MRLTNSPVSTRAAVWLLAISLGIPLGAPLAAETRSPQATPAAVELASIRIDNFGRINANYYRGAQPEGRDYLGLAALGVKTVIDLQADGRADEPDLVRAAGMTFYRIPMTTRVAPTLEQIDQFIKLVTDPLAGPVYVHCAGGRHRTGVMTAIYRMTADHWTAGRAFAEMKSYKFGADFLHPEFKKFVFAYPGQARQVAANNN